jgi:hypothetical protein
VKGSFAVFFFFFLKKKEHLSRMRSVIGKLERCVIEAGSREVYLVEAQPMPLYLGEDRWDMVWPQICLVQGEVVLGTL